MMNLTKKEKEDIASLIAGNDTKELVKSMVKDLTVNKREYEDEHRILMLAICQICLNQIHEIDDLEGALADGEIINKDLRRELSNFI